MNWMAIANVTQFRGKFKSGANQSFKQSFCQGSGREETGRENAMDRIPAIWRLSIDRRGAIYLQTDLITLKKFSPRIFQTSTREYPRRRSTLVSSANRVTSSS